MQSCLDHTLQVFFVNCLEGPTGGPRSTNGAELNGGEPVSKIKCWRCVFQLRILSPLSRCSSSSVGKSPKVLWNRPVAATYLKSAGNVLGVMRSFVMSMFLPPVLLCKICLASRCAVQCNIKCCNVSSPCWHSGQIGESTFPMRYKCLARGVWPVLNCESMLASFHGRFIINLRYLLEGVVGSVFFILVYRGDFCHSFCALHFSVSLKAHFAADMLCGSVFLRSLGSCCLSLLPLLACQLVRYLPLPCGLVPIVPWHVCCVFSSVFWCLCEMHRKCSDLRWVSSVAWLG